LLRSSRTHLIALGLSLGLAAASGLAHFAYALSLPSMRADLEWSYAQAGFVGTANGAGYLVGTLLALWLIRRIAPAHLFRLGLLLGAALLIATSMTRDFILLSALRAASGFAAAPVLIAGSVLAARITPHDAERSQFAVGIFLAGTGLGLLISGVLLPAMFESLGEKAWPEAWFVLGLIAFVSLPFSWWASRLVNAEAPPVVRARWPWADYLPAFGAYACFAAGYIIYLTFAVAWAQEQGANMLAVIALWASLGLAALLAPAFWQPLGAHLPQGQLLAATIAMTALGTGIALLGAQPPALVVSAALFGFGFFMVPGAVAGLVERTLPREAVGGASSAFTIVFAVSQMLGPALAGWVSDLMGTLRAGLGLGVVILATGACLALVQRGEEQGREQGAGSE
jgi:MFS family permease